MKSCLSIGCLGTLAATAVLAVAMAMTCPKPAEHYAALNELVGQTIDQQITGTDDLATQVVAALGRVAFDKMGTGIVERMVSVDDYVVVSIGRMQWHGEKHIVSVGIMRHVFTPTKEQVAKAAQEAL